MTCGRWDRGVVGLCVCREPSGILQAIGHVPDEIPVMRFVSGYILWFVLYGLFEFKLGAVRKKCHGCRFGDS